MGSVSLARQAAMVITEGKSQRAVVGAVLPGEAEDADKEERLASSAGSNISIADGLTSAGGEGQGSGSVVKVVLSSNKSRVAVS